VARQHARGQQAAAAAAEGSSVKKEPTSKTAEEQQQLLEATHRLSRSTRAAARKAKELVQECEGTPQRGKRAEGRDTGKTKEPDPEKEGASKQGKHGRVRMEESDKGMEATESARTVLSVRRLTESQAAADTLAKVHFELLEHALHDCAEALIAPRH
jgi:hypothetical protein